MIYSRKGWCFLGVTGEFETETDCYILTQSSSDHSGTSFAFWLGCSTVGHRRLAALSLQADSHAGTLSLTDSNCNWNSNWLKLSVAPGYIIVGRPPASCGCTHLPPSPSSTTSTGQGDIPISSTGCTCFAVTQVHLLIDGSVEGQYVTWGGMVAPGSLCANNWLILNRINSVIWYSLKSWTV